MDSNKMYEGIIKKVPSDKNFEDYNKGKIDLSDITLKDTIISKRIEGNEIDVLPIRLAYSKIERIKDMDVKSYMQTPILYASGSQIKELVNMGEYHPVKIVASIELDEHKSIYKINDIEDMKEYHQPIQDEVLTPKNKIRI